MLGDLAGDEGPVIVSDDAVVTVVAAEAAEILGLEPGSAVVAAEVVVVQVREELRPDLDRVAEERERIRAEERAELQRQYDEFERSGCGCVRRGWRSLEPSSR